MISNYRRFEIKIGGTFIYFKPFKYYHCVIKMHLSIDHQLIKVLSNMVNIESPVNQKINIQLKVIIPSNYSTVSNTCTGKNMNIQFPPNKSFKFL